MTHQPFETAGAATEQPSGHRDRPDRVGEIASEFGPIPAVCRLDDLVPLLRVSRRTLYRQKALGLFPLPELPRIGTRPRYAGVDVLRYLRGELTSVRGVHRRRA